MRKKTYEEVKQIFRSQGCELLDEYQNNAVKMSFKCKCGRVAKITLNQFHKSPQCYECGMEQMRESKDKGPQPCRRCKSTSDDMMDRRLHGNICRECYNKEHREHRRKNKHKYFDLEKHKEYQKTVPVEYKRYHVNKSYYKARLAALKNYSPDLCCQKCGFDGHVAALSIDHINGDGASHRRELGKRHIVHWLKENNYPEGFQVLCMNCNFIKAWENKEHN